jgi:hypothetical protein
MILRVFQDVGGRIYTIDIHREFAADVIIDEGKVAEAEVEGRAELPYRISRI